jgi:two-component system phosphate regulon sensor histidine kinase PhoR
MFWRLLSFLLCQLLGALAGWFIAPDGRPLPGAFLGVVLGGLFWFLLDLSRGARLLAWLRLGNVSSGVLTSGLWGEVSERTRRLVRMREQQVRDSDNRLQDFLAALQASPSGVVLLDSHGRIEWFNQTAAAHFGFDAQRDLLQHFGNLVRDPGFAAYYARQDFRRDVTMPGRDNTPTRPVTLSVQIHPYGEGRRLVLSRDVTALEQAEAMRRDFVANVTHEIRTPLTVLTGFVETLQTLQLNEQEHERYLALMAQQAERMQTLVSDLLTLSRIEGFPLPGTSDWVPLRGLGQQLEQEARALSAAMGSTGSCVHELHFSAMPEIELAGSANELLSAMSNLVGNAIRYTPAGGSVQVKMMLLEDGRAEFSVRDSGPGIAPEHIPRLTERFYRVDRSRSRETGGTGLGLAIVKHVLQRHGAELKIDSAPGKGSVFSMLFPASRIRPALGVPALSLQAADA